MPPFQDAPLATGFDDDQESNRAREIFAAIPKSEAMMEMVGWKFERYHNGELKLSYRPSETLCNPMGIIHGGLVASMLDDAMGAALLAKLDGKKSA